MFEKLVSFTKKVADLADKPSLNPSELKAQFDAAPDEVRVYLNKLVDALVKTTAGDSGAKNIGVTTITGVTGADIQTVLENLVILSGSNANGNYVKFPDGTLICTMLKVFDGQNASFFSNGASGTATPFTFVGNYNVNVTAYNTDGAESANGTSETYGAANGGNLVRWGVKFPSAVPVGKEVRVSVTMIGRWK